MTTTGRRVRWLCVAAMAAVLGSAPGFLSTARGGDATAPPQGAESRTEEARRLVEQGDEFEAQDRHAEAIAAYRAAIAADPSLVPEVEPSLGASLLWADRTEEAVKVLSSAAARNPDDLETRKLLALAMRGEALYCSGGKSAAAIREEGCNCVTCPLYDRCGSFNVAYFCVHGHCGARDDRPVAARLKALAGSYLERFTAGGEDRREGAPVANRAGGAETGITLRFIHDKDVRTTSNTTILNAALGAGIPHTHV